MVDRTRTDYCHRGTLYAEGNTTAESTVDATPRKIAALDTAGVNAGLTVDTGNNEMVCVEAGDYIANATACFSGSNNSTCNITIYIDTASTNLALERKLGTNGDVGSAAVQGLVTLAVGEAVSLYQSTVDGSVMTITDAQLTLVRVSG